MNFIHFLRRRVAMSDLYSVRKSGLLKLKGEKDKKKKSKKRKHEDKEHKDHKKIRSAERQDAVDHGGWWSVTEFKHITGSAILINLTPFIKVV